MIKRLVFIIKYINIVIIIKCFNVLFGEQEWFSYPVMIIGPIIGLTLYDIFNYLINSSKNNKKAND